jgi:hypothetical protein
MHFSPFPCYFLPYYERPSFTPKQGKVAVTSFPRCEYNCSRLLMSFGGGTRNVVVMPWRAGKKHILNTDIERYC